MPISFFLFSLLFSFLFAFFLLFLFFFFFLPLPFLIQAIRNSLTKQGTKLATVIKENLSLFPKWHELHFLLSS